MIVNTATYEPLRLRRYLQFAPQSLLYVHFAAKEGV